MNEYLELADKLEKLASSDEMLLEKIASLSLLYEYSRLDGSLLDQAELIKEAELLYDENSFATRLGIECVLEAIEGLEVEIVK